jgi:endonuclease G
MKFILLILLTIDSYTGDVIVLDDSPIRIEYNLTLRSPVKVSYVVTADMIKAPSYKKRLGFIGDKRLLRSFRTYTSWYRGTGYDRGHLAPDATFDNNKTILKYAYRMTNIIPMDRSVNRVSWRAIERMVRVRALKNDIYVTNVIVYKKPYRKVKKLFIPDGFYKIITENNSSTCYYYRNEFDNSYIRKHEVECKKIK